jgi:hypothetical protein
MVELQRSEGDLVLDRRVEELCVHVLEQDADLFMTTNVNAAEMASRGARRAARDVLTFRAAKPHRGRQTA